MKQEQSPEAVLTNWNDILGADARIVSQYPERELWLIANTNGREYYLKRLGPWRNLSVANEARVLQYLADQHVRIAAFIPTDHAHIYAGEVEDSFVLMPRLTGDTFNPGQILEMESEIGNTVAQLHRALACYPESEGFYTEDLAGSLQQELMLPPEIATLFAERRMEMIAALDGLPLQLIHGDLTPENIVLRNPVHEAGFIDFEHLPFAPRIWDIAKYLSRRLRLAWRENSPKSEQNRAVHIAPFLRGYQARIPLTTEELATLPSLIAAANIIEVSYFLEIAAGTLIRRKLSDHDQVLADSVEAAHWHLTHWGQVVSAVQSGNS